MKKVHIYNNNIQKIKIYNETIYKKYIKKMKSEKK